MFGWFGKFVEEQSRSARLLERIRKRGRSVPIPEDSPVVT